MPSKGTKNSKIHWSVLDTSGERHYFTSTNEVSEFCQHTWGSGPMKSELVSRVAKQLLDRNCKESCPVWKRYHGMDICRVRDPLEAQLFGDLRALKNADFAY